MRVLFDNQIFMMQRFGGISRYFKELFLEMNEEAIVPVPFSRNVYVPGEKGFIFDNSNTLVKKAGSFLTKRKNKAAMLKAQREEQYDIFHPTYYDPYFLNTVKAPLVVTVYDMTHEKYPQYFDKGDSTSANKKILCERADKILAISQSTKNDLVELFALPEDKIEVTYLSGGLEIVGSQDSLQLPERYILFVGNRSGYKNFQAFYNALVPILKKDRSLHLVCTGPSFTDIENKQFGANGLTDRVHHLFAKENEFYSIYNRALFFVFPSLYEGFGIPVLEAMSADCPLLVSNTSSLPEVAGNGGLYFDPNMENDLFNKMEQLIGDKQLREELIGLGRTQLEKFSWKKTAFQTKEIYKVMLKNN